MQVKSLIGGAGMATLVLGAVACYGTVDKTDVGGPKVVGARAELVVKKRDWLKNYDNNCEICFSAFELCEKGADSSEVKDACKIALDSCVRGGTEVDPDPNADGGIGIDNGGGGGDNDDNDNDADDAGDEAVDEDAGEPDGDEEDAGVDNGGDADEDAGEPDEDDEEDAGVDNGGGGGDNGKEKLFENIGICLDQARTCLDGNNADRKACVSALKACVKAAVKGAFEDSCEGQISACIAEKVPAEALQSVQGLCEQDLGL